MGKNARVDQIPMLDDDSLRSVEMGALDGSDDYSLKIIEEDDINLYGNTGASVAVEGHGNEDFGKHEHLLKSGPMGKCSDPFCQTCPSYFGYSDQQAPQQKKTLFGRGNQLGSKAATWSRRWIPGILNPHTKSVKQWNKVFCISAGIAIFTDPLFFYLLSVRRGDVCLVFNNSAAVAVTVFRSLTDAIYVCHILLQFRLAYIRPASKVKGAGELEDHPKKIAINYLKGWFILDLFTALPLPQILIWTVLGKASGANYAKNALRVIVLVQNIPRSIRFFPLLIGRTPNGFIFETAWSSFVINLLTYALAGHIVGSCWYLFGVQRVNDCLRRSCNTESSGIATFQNGPLAFCQTQFLDCGADGNYLEKLNDDENHALWLNYTSLRANCLVQTPPDFTYGIYGLGIPVILENSTINKYIYSLFWGFQQISTLAGNQQPSTFIGEVLFTTFIVGLGLLLFALLIGNIQNFLQSLQRRKLEMQLNRYDTEAWMKQRKLPPSLQKRVKDAGRFRWVATRGVEEQELIKDLPEDLQKDIQRYLCLDLVKKVELFKLLEEHVLDAICERLYQKLYIENSEIFREKKPVERMLFIVRGKLESRGDDGSVAPLKEGNFCGEELLSWYIDKAGVSTSKKWVKHRGKHPPSSRTVKCLSSVEAYSLDSEALEYITTHYKAAFRSPRVRGVIRYLSPFWRSQAAIRIQKAWRAHMERTNQSNRGSSAQHRDGDGSQRPTVHRITRFGTMNSRY